MKLAHARWTYLPFIRSVPKTILQGTVKGARKQGRQKEEKKEVGRQHQAMDGPGVRQFPEGVVENRGKMEETGCEVISGAPTTPAVKGEVKVKKEIPAQHNTLSDGDLKVCLSYNKA